MSPVVKKQKLKIIIIPKYASLCLLCKIKTTSQLDVALTRSTLYNPYNPNGAASLMKKKSHQPPLVNKFFHC